MKIKLLLITLLVCLSLSYGSINAVVSTTPVSVTPDLQDVTGESITMDGDDLYVKDNTEIDGFLVLGSNTEAGLSAGDINASTVYYDTLVAKSPTFLCEQDTNWCQVTVPQYQESLYIDFTSDWQVEEVRFKENTYTPQEFLQNVCPTNSNTQAICDEIIEKYQKLKTRYDTNKNYKTFVTNCESAGNTLRENECVSITIEPTTYEGATQSTQRPIYNYTTVTEYSLDDDLRVVELNNTVKDSIIGYDTIYSFKEGCGWNQDTSYYCEVSTVTEVFN